MNTINDIYNIKSRTPSDINEHMPILYEYAQKVNHITEFGTRYGCSTWAFLNSNPKKMISYDIKKEPEIDKILQIANQENIDFTFIEADSLIVNIENTDLLFIDTFHSYNQLRSELTLHHKKVRKFIIMHDTYTYGYQDMPNVGPISDLLDRNVIKQGLMTAILDFLKNNSEWSIEKEYINNNGLTILNKNENNK